MLRVNPVGVQRIEARVMVVEKVVVVIVEVRVAQYNRNLGFDKKNTKTCDDMYNVDVDRYLYYNCTKVLFKPEKGNVGRKNHNN